MLVLVVLAVYVGRQNDVEALKEGNRSRQRLVAHGAAFMGKSVGGLANSAAKDDGEHNEHLKLETRVHAHVGCVSIVEEEKVGDGGDGGGARGDDFGSAGREEGRVFEEVER